MSRYPEALWHPLDGDGTPLAGPKRLVLHTTEGVTVAGAEAAYRAKGVAPHFTADPVHRQLIQHIDTARSSSALRNNPGGVETNRAGRVIQVEIVGYAAHTQELEGPELGWLGWMILLICTREGINPHSHPAFVGQEAGTIATEHAPQRMTPAAWSAFTGVCGHQHVPENTHWDPGHFPYDRALAHAGGSSTPEEEDVALTDDDKAWIHDELGIVGGARTANPDAGGADRSDVWRWDRETVILIRSLTAQVAALSSAVEQLGAGGTVDYGRVQDAAEAAVKKVLGAVDE